MSPMASEPGSFARTLRIISQPATSAMHDTPAQKHNQNHSELPRTKTW